MIPNQDKTTSTESFFAPAEQYVYSHIVSPHPRSSGAVCADIPFSINIALRWSAAFSTVSRIYETRRKIDVLLNTQLLQTENCPNDSI